MPDRLNADKFEKKTRKKTSGCVRKRANGMCIWEEISEDENVVAGHCDENGEWHIGCVIWLDLVDADRRMGHKEWLACIVATGERDLGRAIDFALHETTDTSIKEDLGEYDGKAEAIRKVRVVTIG